MSTEESTITGTAYVNQVDESREGYARLLRAVFARLGWDIVVVSGQGLPNVRPHSASREVHQMEQTVRDAWAGRSADEVGVADALLMLESAGVIPAED